MARIGLNFTEWIELNWNGPKGISNFFLNVAKDAAVSRRKAKPILKSNTEGRNSKKEAEVKGGGRKLTLGSREERVSRLVSKCTDECSVESKLRKWGVKNWKNILWWTIYRGQRGQRDV